VKTERNQKRLSKNEKIMQELFENDENSGLTGQLLIAMPNMHDPVFSDCLIYICAHSQEGAMGLIINRQTNDIDFSDLLEKIFTPQDASPITLTNKSGNLPFIHIGGPMETGRGFVLHSPDYHSDDHTFPVNETVSLTATLDILKAIAKGQGPAKSLLALGYAGWGPGQLEQEISNTGWLHCAANQDLLFDIETEKKYNKAIKSLGINPTHFVNQTGHS